VAGTSSLPAGGLGFFSPVRSVEGWLTECPRSAAFFIVPVRIANQIIAMAISTARRRNRALGVTYFGRVERPKCGLEVLPKWLKADSFHRVESCRLADTGTHYRPGTGRLVHMADWMRERGTLFDISDRFAELHSRITLGAGSAQVSLWVIGSSQLCRFLNHWSG